MAGADQFVDGFDLGTIAPQEADAIVVATQGVGDRDALEAALTSDADYVAMVGSRKKIAALKKALIGKGLPATRLDRLRGPAGLDIGAIEPEEIALSILAEIVQSRRRTQRDRATPADTAPA
jgi:xanthine dehydrogenase accessory factor